ncbi:MAG: hypothetical protein JSV23_01125 [Promethearchaeota archaeon]|nr:MAG: hypothetical protein JSV23_01125 [Candidatus Lokiarchaeota archaeon]
MSISIELKQEFLTNFQNKIITARKLLFSAKHEWASRVFRSLTSEIKKNDWLDLQKKHQLIMIISNSWWMYLNSLVKHKEGKVDIDLIRYIDAYKRFFSFLAKLDDFYLFNNFCTNLLKEFLKKEDLSQKGITKFINSFSAMLHKKEYFQKLFELQILQIFLRKSVAPSEYFHLSMEILGKTVFNVEPSKRALFIYILLEDVCLKYNLMQDSAEFVRLINKILINRLPGYLKNEFSNISRITINERSFNTILVDLEELIYYLNDIGEYSWIIIFVRSIFSKIQEYQSNANAVIYIRKFINFSINRNRFEIAFEIYDFLEDLFMFQTDLSYDNILIELWVEACKKFVDMKEKRYLLQSLEKLNNHLKLPQKNAQIFHYFYTCNILWQFKSMFFSLEQRDFWRMMFFRALFEEQNYDIAEKIIPHLDKDFSKILTGLKALYNDIEPLKKEIYIFDDYDDIPQSFHKDFTIKHLILRINSKGRISYRMISANDELIEGTISNEFWNDTQIIEIYNELFYESEDRKFNFNLREFGELLYIFLPKLIRNFFKAFKIESLDLVPQIYFVLDNMTIPFDLIYDNNYFLLKYSSGYHVIVDDVPLRGVTFEDQDFEGSSNDSAKKGYNILIIDSINSKSPLKWNEKTRNKELIFPFQAGADELNYLINFFNEREEIDQIATLIGDNSTRENILSNLSAGMYHVIVFVGNIFYSKWSPKNSFFLTNDNHILTFNEINKTVSKNNSKTQPFIFFNSQVYDIEGKKIRNTLKSFGDIVSQFNYNKIIGIISKNYPIFNNETKQIISNFFINLLNNNSQGDSLLKARQQCIASKMEKVLEQQVKDSASETGITRIDLRSSLAISSYLLFGKPWKKISS